MNLPPPRFSFVASVRSGKRKILAEMSVHSPTATKSDVVAPSPSGLMSRQAISTSSTVCLQKNCLLIAFCIFSVTEVNGYRKLVLLEKTI